MVVMSGVGKEKISEIEWGGTMKNNRLYRSMKVSNSWRKVMRVVKRRYSGVKGDKSVKARFYQLHTGGSEG